MNAPQNDILPGGRSAVPGLTADRPRRWPYVLAGGLGLLALVVALSSGGPQGGYGARAGVYALTADDLAATGRWVPSAGPVDFGRVFSAARALPGVAAPDDRHVAAFRSADGSAEVFQVTVLYDDAADAASLVRSGAVASLSSAFGLTSEPWALDGADDVRRWRGPGVEALSFRVAGAVVFVGARGTGAAPIVELAAAAVRDRLAASPPATGTSAESEHSEP